MTTIAEGNPPFSTPPPASVPGGGPPRSDEPDLLAERRARRPAESGEHALLRRAEAAEATVKTLEAHVLSLQQRLAEHEGEGRRTTALAERVERVEDALLAIRESHRRMAVTIGELREVTIRLRVLADREPQPSPPPAPEREEMAEALAAAVERLRARAQQTAAPPPAPSAPPPVARKPHRHSMSLIGRWRRARKQRREGR